MSTRDCPFPDRVCPTNGGPTPEAPEGHVEKKLERYANRTKWLHVLVSTAIALVGAGVAVGVGSHKIATKAHVEKINVDLHNRVEKLRGEVQENIAPLRNDIGKLRATVANVDGKMDIMLRAMKIRLVDDDGITPPRVEKLRRVQP